MQTTTWRVRPADPRGARELARGAGVHPLTAQLLLHRDVTAADDARRFLRPSLEALSDPRDLPDVERAAARLRDAIARGERILIFGDSDVDGLTASVILYEALASLGADVRAVQSNRISDGYGVPEHLLQAVCRPSTNLVVLVDCGTNQPSAVDQLTRAGIDTIIVDHHVPLDGWAAPYALVNPHRVPGGRFHELCSAGLAFRLAQALVGPGGDMAPYLDLAALGTLADCSPLRGDSRTLVASGAASIVNSRRRGLARLCDDTRTTDPDPEKIVRQLVPRLNACGRLGDASAVWNVLRQGSDDRLQDWVDELDTAHATTKQLHRQVLMEAQEQVNRLHFRDQYVLVVSRAGWHQGLMGPLATQLSQRYGRPAIAIAMNEQSGTGSARSIPALNLLETLKTCESLLMRFGGHAQACGLTLDRKHLDTFRALINERVRLSLGAEGLVRHRWIDLEVGLRELDTAWVGELARFAPFGHSNPKPTVLLRGVAIERKSPRIGTIVDGTRRIAARGVFPPPVAGQRYDVVASPMLAERELLLWVNDVKGSAEPSAPVRTASTPCTPSRA